MKYFRFCFLLLPEVLCCNILYYLSNINLYFIKNILIYLFICFYNIDLTICKKKNFYDYKNLNSFFIRSIKKKFRPINKNFLSIVSPVDSIILDCGFSNANNYIDIKGNRCMLINLLGYEIFNFILNFCQYINVYFIVFYLSPSDCHRIYMPVTSKLLKMYYINGRFSSVNPNMVSNLSDVFIQNERIVLIFKTILNTRIVLILIGALMVGNIDLVFLKKKLIANVLFDYINKKLYFLKGDELGRFNLGSTVIMIILNNFKNDRYLFNHYKNIVNNKVFFGQEIGFYVR